LPPGDVAGDYDAALEAAVPPRLLSEYVEAGDANRPPTEPRGSRLPGHVAGRSAALIKVAYDGGNRSLRSIPQAAVEAWRDSKSTGARGTWHTLTDVAFGSATPLDEPDVGHYKVRCLEPRSKHQSETKTRLVDAVAQEG
jgi:hypothetical protein